jgi:hypothetical protein
MNSRRVTWTIVALFILSTIAVTLGTSGGQTRQRAEPEPTPPTANPFGDLSRYPVATLDAPEPSNALEREARRIKNKRYDSGLIVAMNPHPDDTASIFSDAEPVPPAIPSEESALIVMGEVQDSKGLLSNEQKTIYSEFSIVIRSILKEDPKKKLKVGELIYADRSGGVVLYPNGQKILYLNDWQDLPERTKKYLLFLDREDDPNPNYRIITGYQLQDGSVTALDKYSIFTELNGTKVADLIRRVLNKSN